MLDTLHPMKRQEHCWFTIIYVFSDHLPNYTRLLGTSKTSLPKSSHGSILKYRALRFPESFIHCRDIIFSSTNTCFLTVSDRPTTRFAIQLKWWRMKVPGWFSLPSSTYIASGRKWDKQKNASAREQRTECTTPEDTPWLDFPFQIIDS